MDLPRASVCSRSTGRLRIRVPVRRNDPEFFRNAMEQLAKLQPFRRLEANELTGSLLLEADRLDPAAVAEHARAHRLFDLSERGGEPAPLMSRLVPPVKAADRTLLSLTGGALDLASGIFLALVLTGAYQILRGQFRTPPWYTAFWYAFGLLTMFVVKKSASDGGDEASD